jgi:hypothetical protein
MTKKWTRHVKTAALSHGVTKGLIHEGVFFPKNYYVDQPLALVQIVLSLKSTAKSSGPVQSFVITGNNIENYIENCSFHTLNPFELWKF